MTYHGSGDDDGGRYREPFPPAACGDCVRKDVRVAALEREVERLRRLESYAQHLPECLYPGCTCGLDAARGGTP